MKKAYLMFGILLVFGAARTFADNAFTGQSSDASHAYYLRARYYDPETGIFLTKDPMGVSAGLNSYQYVFNNPVNSADPLGLFGFWDYTAQVGSYVGGTIVAIAGVSATAAGAATSEIGVGVPIVAGGLYLTAQGGSSMVASGRNLWYMILNPSATEVPLNSSGLVGAAVSAYEGSSSLSAVNSDGSWSSAGFANSSASMIDVLTTFNVGGAVQALNNQAQVARYLPGLAPGLVTDGQAAMIARAYGLQTTELAGFGGAFDGISDAASSIGSVDNTKSGFAPFFGGSESSSQQSPADAALGQFLLQNPLSQYGIYGNPLASSPPVGGVLLDTAATLVGQNLSDITGAMYDPVSGQFVFLGTNNVAPVKNINLDYLYTALQAVYGSAVPPFVTLNPSAQITSSASQTESLSVTVYPSGTYYGGLSGGTTHTLNGTFTSPFLDVYPYELLEYYGDPVGWDEGLYASVIIFPGDDAYATMPYSPIWPGEDTNVDVVLQGVDYGPELNQSGKFSWRARFNCVSNNLVFSQWIADAHDTIPSGGTMSFSPVPVAYGPYGETSYNLTFVNSSDYILISSAVAIPARQQRQFGGRVENTMVGWIMEEADRTMKCLWIGSNNITGAAYNSSTIHVSGYKNLFELYGNSTPTNCSVRNWFTPKLMTLQQYIDPNTGLASIVFSNATVLCQTENDLTGGASPQQDQAFCNNMTAQYDAFATNKFPCYDPTDPTGSRIIYTNIFGMLKDVMKAVSLARFFRDNNIPVDMWWLNSWQCPVAYTPKSVPTIVAYSANKTYTISGGVYIQLPNAYVASVTASNVAQLVQSSRPDAAGNSSGDIKQQVWTANTSVGNLTAVSLNSAGEPQDGNVNLAETDLAFASPGAMPLQFTRSYQSSWLGGDAMGPGWSYAPYELQFSRPSWYDDYGWMTDNYGDLLPVFPGTSDTGLRSDSLRVVNMSSGATLDFISSLVLGYAVDANNLPYITLNGLTADGVPMFTPGLRQNGSMLIQIADQREYQLFTPDGSVLVFDSNGKLLQIQDRNGWQQDYNYDNAGHLMSVTDDTQQSLVFTYDAQTNYLTSVIGPNGEQVNYTYTTNGCLAMAQHVRSGAYVSYQYNTNRQLIAKTLFNGLNVIQSQPDLKGRANTNMDVRGNSVIKTFTQGHAGTVRTNEIRDPQITDPKFVSRRLQRDRSGRLLASRTQTGAETSYGYNTNSLLPNTVALPIAGRPPITIQRDAYGRPTRITDPGNTNAQDVTATYDPDTTLLQQVTDEAGHATQLYYDGNQNLTDVQTALGTQNVNVNFGYSPSGSLSSIQNPLGITVVTMNRDNLNRVTNVVDATGVSINYQYDALGRLWKLIDPQLASPVVYVYDNFDRVIEIHLPAGTNYYTYDPKMGWLTSQTDLLGRTTRYDHDPNTGDIVQIVQIVPGGANLVTVMSYDRFGNLASVTPPGAGTISYNYDNSGRQVGSVQSGVGIPGTPISLTCNNATNGLPTIYTNFVFSWLPPVSSVGVAGYSYALDQMPASITNTLATNATINGVSVGTHLFQVSAQGTNGMWGPTADFLLVVTNVPGSIPPGAPPGLICDHATNDVPTCYTSFTFSWSVPTSQNGVAGYSYALDQAPPSSVSTTGTTATFANVSFGTHLFHVQALGANGIWGPTSDFVLLVAPAPAITPPDAPPGLTCDHATNGVQTYYTSFMFSWSVPNSHNGIAGYSYALDQIPLNSVLTTATNFAITNVSYGIHLFQVQAQDNNGLWGPTADFQLIVAWVPGTLPPGAPEVFCNLTVSGSPTTYTNFVFSWSVPFSENGIAGYSYGFDQDAPDAVLTLMNTAPVRNVSLGTHSFVVKALGSNGVWGAEGEFDLEVVQPPASSVPYGATAIIEGAPTCGSLVCGCLASMFDPGYTITTNNSGWMTYQGTMTNQISWEPSITIACNFQGSLTGINDLNNDPNNAYGQSTTIVVSDIDPPSDYPPYAPYYYDEEQIGVIPYVFVRNQALSGVNNISADEATLLFSSSGAVPGQPFHGMTASYLGGSSNSPIYLIGVNSSSGTRMQVENIVGFLGSSVYWASDGVSPYSITNGYPLESMIADLVARRPDAIGYVDYSNYKRCLGSVIAMRYNGVTCTTNTVANGSYELWGYARVISLSQMGSLQHQIYDALISNLNSASFQSSPVYRNALVPLSIMQVERDQDFGPIYPFLWGD